MTLTEEMQYDYINDLMTSTPDVRIDLPDGYYLEFSPIR